MVTTLFALDNVDDDDHLRSEQINLDELYERRKEQNLKELELFQKMLNKIHQRIKAFSRRCQYCWFVVPELILGAPKYNQAHCIAYLIDRLQTNGFQVRYIQPNTLFISWMHFIPSYIRHEIKKKTGVEIDAFGNPVGAEEEDTSPPATSSSSSTSASSSAAKPKRQYKPLEMYKSSGKFTYDNEMLHDLETTLHSLQK